MEGECVRKLEEVVGQEKHTNSRFLDSFRAKLSADTMVTVGKLDPLTLTDMLKACDQPDEMYVVSLLKGFPITEVLEGHGTGARIPGGQRTHGKPAHGEVYDVESLKRIMFFFVVINKNPNSTSDLIIALALLIS